MNDSEGEGPVHFLTVHSAELTNPEEPKPFFQNWELDYEIDHPWNCKKREHTTPDDAVWWLDWTCDIAEQINNSGLDFNLYYSGTRVTKPGLYLVRSWWRKYYVFDYGAYEWDAGIGVVAP